MVEHESYYIFYFVQPTKTIKPGKKKEPLKISRFDQDPELCPVKHIKVYLEKTKDLRKDKKPTRMVLIYIRKKESD